MSKQLNRWRHLYNKATWYKRSRYQLSMEPFCKFHLAMGKTVVATVADHIEPHHGDEFKFYHGALQSLCKPCHDSAKRSEEMRGYSTMIGVDGYPTDRKHPFYQGHIACN